MESSKNLTIVHNVELKQSNLPFNESPDEKATNRTIFILKFLYFLTGICWSSWGRFSIVFYTKNNLTNIQIGTIEGTLVISYFFFSTILGYIADKIKNKKLVFLVSYFIGSALMSLLAFDYIVSFGFKSILFCVTIGSGLTGFDFLNAYSLDILGENSKKWGRLRLWLALSWGIWSFVFFYVYSIFEDFKINFLFFIIFNSIYFLIILIYLPGKTKEESTNKVNVDIKTILRVFNNRRTIFFISEVFIVFICFGFVEKFMFVYLLNDLKGPLLLAGLTVIVTVTFEIPLFYFSKIIIDKTNIFVRLGIAILSHCIRMIGYNLLTPESVNYILFFELFHGITFALLSMSLTEFIKTISPPELITSITNIVNTFCMSVAFSLASFMGGYIIDYYGSKYLYTLTAYIMIFMLVLHVVLIKFKCN